MHLDRVADRNASATLGACGPAWSQEILFPLSATTGVVRTAAGKRNDEPGSTDGMNSPLK